MNSSHSAFLVRPKALPGESLSSWRQRVAWANGYRLFPVRDGRTRRVDPDMGSDVADIGWMADLHGCQDSTCRLMTLGGHVGHLVDRVASRSQPSWWLRSRYGKTAPSHGSMFCSQCLDADEVPYFRLSWRFGFTTVCSVHHTLLIDRCPGCQRPPWPSACGVGDRISNQFHSMGYCPYCDFDLTDANCSGLASPTILDHLLDDTASVQVLFNAPCVEALAAIRSICHLFIRNRSRKAILESNSKWSAIAQAVSETALQFNSVDHAPVGDRHLLVTAALEICKDWPSSFLTFAKEASITRMHFNAATKLQPAWMTTIVDNHLAKQNRFVSEETLNEAHARMSAMLGRPPYKFELRRELQWQGSRWLDTLYAGEM